MGLPWCLSGKESACLAGDMDSILGPEDPPEKEMATLPVFLPGKSHRQRSLESMGLQRVGHDLVTEHACTAVS